MSILRERLKPKAEKWARYRYNLTTNIGENGKRLTGCKEHIELSRKAASEGMVLLENNGLLPLKEQTKVALFGIGSLDYIKGGGGSGMVYSEYVRNLYEGLKTKEPKISIYEPVTRYYYDYAVKLLEEDKANIIIPEIDVPEKLVDEASENADVAIITIHRYSCEESDRMAEKGDFYLTDTEQKMVDDVTSKFEHSVVVLNIGGIIDVSWVKNNPRIDAFLIAWQAGMEGGLAVADILCGDINPSGKLTDTFAKTFSDYPFADSFNESDDYVEYYEDIFVGYRYFETLSGAKDKVNYPFGFGLSYTEFELSKPIAVLENGKIKVSLAVKNIGDVAGKEVIQVYYSAPHGVLGKSSISLAAFYKTKLLNPCESEDVVLSFDVNDMASYDDLGKCKKSCYVLEKGDYKFFVGNSCRNLLECEYKYTVKEEFIVTKQLEQRCAPNKINKRMLSNGSFEELPQFQIKEYDYSVEEKISKENNYEEVIPFNAVAENKITLDEFINQMTNDELIEMVSGIKNRGASNTCGIGGIDRLEIPAIMTVDGPAGIRIRPRVGICTTAWPCATLIACTWNTELAYEIGRAGALEAKENGFAVWLTPALNIHRNPLCGRNFEYFSEDPLVSGKFAAAKVNGIQSTNTAASVKHFAANNKETNRKYSDSRMSERALREIYLHGFEICVRESNPWTVMTSYNIINGQRVCESSELIEGVLRQEWGYDGMVTSDWHVPCNQEKCVIAGNDIRMPVGYPEVLSKALEEGRIHRCHLEKCVKRILQMILKLD